MNEVFSEKVTTERRTYFFDVKETREHALYLVIGELTQVGNETERHRVMVFQESVDSFLRGLAKAIAFMKGETLDELQSDNIPRGDWISHQDQENTRENSATEMLRRIERDISEIRKHFK